MTGMNFVYLTACTVYPDASDEELDDFLDTVSSLSKPDILPHQDVYIKSDDYEDYSLTYSNAEPTTPETGVTQTVFFSNITGEDRFHAHSYIESEHLDEILKFQEKVMAPAGDLRVNSLSAIFTLDNSVESILDQSDFISDTGDGVELSAIEFSKNDFNITIYEDPEAGPVASVVKRGISDVRPSEIEEIAKDHKESSQKLLEGGI